MKTIRSLFFAALALLAPALHAATIQWSTSTVSGPADVSTAGTLVGALEAGGGADKTINGVTFADPSSNPAWVTFSPWEFGFSPLVVESAFGGSAAYAEALSTGWFSNPIFSNTATVTLNNLTVGRTYAVQMWIVDTRGVGLSDRVRTVKGGEAVATSTTSGGPNIATGVFTADATTQSITIADPTSSYGPQLNLLQLRDVTDLSYLTNLFNPTFNQMNPSTLGFMAQAFDTGSVPAQLTGVTLRLATDPNIGGTVPAKVELWSSAPTATVPAEKVADLGETAPFGNFNDVAYTVTGAAAVNRPLLAPNSRYWVVVSNPQPGSGSFLWRNTNQDNAVSNAGAVLPSVRANRTDSGASWSSFGTGNRQLLSLSTLLVTNTNDAGPGSLRQAMTDAAALPGADTITFHPALSGGTIALSTFDGFGGDESALVVNDSGGVTLNASALPGGLTICDGSLTDFRLFSVQSGSSLALHGLTLKDGGGPTSGFDPLFGGSGGAIRNDGTLSLTRCTLTGCYAGGGGGAISNNGTAMLTHCTLSGNTSASPAPGGAINNSGTLALAHCTLSGNTAGTGGGVNMQISSTLTLTNTLIVGNTITTGGAFGPDILNGGTVTRQGVNIVQFLTNNGTVDGPGSILAVAAPLAPLGNYGGPVPTRPPLPGSPAIDAGADTAETRDQRGLARAVDADGDGTAQPDIGAVELQVRRVTTTADENDGLGVGAGTSLREALADPSGGSDIVRFDPSVFTGATPATNTISLGVTPFTSTAIILSNRAVTVDARDIPAGVTIDDGSATDYRLFRVESGSTVAFHALTLANGGGANSPSGGGAILVHNGGTVVLTRCTLSGNTVLGGGGAIGIDGGGTATLTHCTLSGNTGIGLSSAGGAIFNNGTLTLTHCTLSGNTTGGSGGGIRNGGTLTLTHSLIAGNTASNDGPDIRYDGVNGTITPTGVNFIGNTADSSLTPSGTLLTGDPLLAPALASNGGPTQTLALLAGSPAINAATGSTATTDQRGFPIVGTPDIGAFEGGPIIAVQQPADTDLADGGSVDFGSVNRPGSSAAFTFTILNRGVTDLTLGTRVVEGANADDFAVGTPAVAMLAPGGSTTFSITFTPGAGSHQRFATLRLPSDAPGAAASYDITLVGTSNELPVVQDASVFAVQGVQKTITIAATDADSGDTLAVSATTPDANLTVNATNALGITFTPAANYFGPATLGYTVSDGFGGSASGTIAVNVRPTSPVHTTHLAVDGANTPLAPGAGTNGLPADAKLTSFGPPATSDAGDVAFVGKWKSATSKGTGLFLNDKCVAIVGGPAPIAGAKYVRFTDPLVSGGKLVCIAALTGTTKSVVLSNVNTTGALEVLAQTGGAATADGAKFKAFKAVAIHAGSVGIFAQLTTGTGTPKTTATSDLGLWVFENGTLIPALREGQLVGGKTIKTLVAFKPGAGSPGQGRGWLGTDGDPEVHALAFFTDKTEGVVLRNLDENTAAILSLSGATADGAPDITNAAFATYGLPARNDAQATTFAATMRVDATSGVTKANARGIFLNPALTGKFTPLARIGASAGENGETFSKLGDPVLSPDGSVAFLATIKGGPARGLLAKTLWWKPVGQPLELLAQGSTRPGLDLPAAAQWSSFSSLAITDRGPIFAAKLVAKKGGITAKTATGVWACDFDGKPRALFRTGDIINGKKLAKFTLLKVTVGNAGVTRSFNNTAQVVWLASFTDKTSAIITTEVP